MFFAVLHFYWGDQGVFRDEARCAVGAHSLRGSAEPGGPDTGPNRLENLTLLYRRLLCNHGNYVNIEIINVYVSCLWILSVNSVGSCPVEELALHLNHIILL